MIKRVDQSARILPIHVKKGDQRGKSTNFFSFLYSKFGNKCIKNERQVRKSNDDVITHVICLSDAHVFTFINNFKRF